MIRLVRLIVVRPSRILRFGDTMKPVISVTALGALLGASMLVFGPVGTLMARSIGQINQPPWLLLVAVGVGVYDALLLAYVLALRSQENGRFGKRFRHLG